MGFAITCTLIVGGILIIVLPLAIGFGPAGPILGTITGLTELIILTRCFRIHCGGLAVRDWGRSGGVSVCGAAVVGDVGCFYLGWGVGASAWGAALGGKWPASVRSFPVVST